jgi:hypothetical protein
MPNLTLWILMLLFTWWCLKQWKYYVLLKQLIRFWFLFEFHTNESVTYFSPPPQTWSGHIYFLFRFLFGGCFLLSICLCVYLDFQSFRHQGLLDAQDFDLSSYRADTICYGRTDKLMTIGRSPLTIWALIFIYYWLNNTTWADVCIFMTTRFVCPRGEVPLYAYLT